MTDKQKITEILKAYTKRNNISASSVILEEYAEELVANGVIVPPFKFGSTIWIIRNREIYPHKIDHLVISEFGMYSTGISLKWCVGKLGTTVFLTKEEAEEKLRSLGNDRQI
jgi:hypothetical protein